MVNEFENSLVLVQALQSNNISYRIPEIRTQKGQKISKAIILIQSNATFSYCSTSSTKLNYNK